MDKKQQLKGDAFDFKKILILIVPVINRTAQARKSLSTTHNIREVVTCLASRLAKVGS